MPFSRSTRAISSDSASGTRGSFAPCTMNSGARTGRRRHRRRLVEDVPVVLELPVLALPAAAGTATCARGTSRARDPDRLESRRPQLRLQREPREHHVAAVQRPYSTCATRRLPARQATRAATRGRGPSRAAAAVVEMLVPLPVPGRPADVRRRDRVAARQEMLRQRREAHLPEGQPPLPGRQAPDNDGERPVARRREGGTPARTRRRTSRTGAA